MKEGNRRKKVSERSRKEIRVEIEGKIMDLGRNCEEIKTK